MRSCGHVLPGGDPREDPLPVGGTGPSTGMAVPCDFPLEELDKVVLAHGPTLDKVQKRDEWSKKTILI